MLLTKIRTYNSKPFKIILILFISSLIVEISLGNIADVDVVTKFISSTYGIILFVTISIIFCLAQFSLLGFIDLIAQDKIDKISTVGRLRSFIKTIQWFGAGLLFAIIIQMLLFSYYHVLFLIIASAVSWGSAALIMILLGTKLLSWFKENRSWILLLYALSALSLASYEISMISLATIILIPKDPLVHQNSDVIFPINDVPGSPVAISNTVVQITYNLSFVLFWGSTALFLYGHVTRLGKWRYWMIMGLILVSFLSYLGLVFPELEMPQELQEAGLDIVPSILFATYSAIAGGFLFGIGFLFLSREFRSINLRNHMILAAIGFFILFISNGATIFEAAYPPYGLVNVLVVPLASYLVFHGIFYSAISLSKDMQLRNSVKKSALMESSLIEKMGRAEMENAIRNIVKKAMDTSSLPLGENSVQPSLTEDNLHLYVQKVIRELKKQPPK